MKKILILTFLLLTQMVFSQELASKNLFRINGQVSFGNTRAQVINALGTPTREENEYNEMDEIDVLVLYYGESRITIQEGRVNTFQIKDTSLSISYGSLVINVGNDISTLQSTFPQSFNDQLAQALQPRLSLSILFKHKTKNKKDRYTCF